MSIPRMSLTVAIADSTVSRHPSDNRFLWTRFFTDFDMRKAFELGRRAGRLQTTLAWWDDHGLWDVVEDEAVVDLLSASMEILFEWEQLYTPHFSMTYTSDANSTG